MMPYSIRFGLIAAMFILATASDAARLSPSTAAPTLPPIPQSVAPAYAISGKVGPLSQAILAEIPGLGQVSSLDLLMIFGNAPTLVPVPLEIWTEPNSIAAEPFQPAIRGEIDRLAGLVSLASRSADWNPPADQLRRLGFDGAIAGYAENVVASQVKVEPADIHAYYIAHPEKYLQRRRIDARYIFIRVAPDADDLARTETEQKLEAIARDIRAGRISFEDAARQYSNAPSAATGGKIPTFVNGTYFTAFERQLLDVQPGEMTQVFQGPGGIYLGQLISTTPAVNIPLDEVTAEIRRTLAQEHVKHYYRMALGNLQRRYKIMNYAGGPNYSYMNLKAPLAYVGTTALTRPQFLLCYPDPVQPGYVVSGGMVYQNVSHWVEGEMIQQEMESLGRGNDRYIARARELGTIPLRALQTLRREINPALYMGADASTATLRTGSLGGIRSVLIAQIQMTPDVPNDAPPATGLATERQISELNTNIDRGVLELSEPLIIRDWVNRNDFSTTETTAAAISDLQEQISMAPRPTVKLQVTSLGWVDAAPMTSWYRLLQGLQPGQISPTVKLTVKPGTPPLVSTVRYVVLAERPIDLTHYRGQTTNLEQMAWRALIERALQTEIDRMKAEGAIKYR